MDFNFKHSSPLEELSLQNQNPSSISDEQSILKDEAILVVETFKSLDENLKKEVIKSLIENTPQKKVRKREEFEKELKEEAVEIWKKNRNFAMTARVINSKHNKNIDESYVRRYVNESLPVPEITSIKKRVKIMDPRSSFPELEEELLKWFKDMRQRKLLRFLTILKVFILKRRKGSMRHMLLQLFALLMDVLEDFTKEETSLEEWPLTLLQL